MLSGGLLVAAAMKVRRRHHFSRSLRWAVGSHAGAAAWLVCLAELAVAGAVAARPGPGGLAAAGWVLAASLYIGLLLAKTSDTECNCWAGEKRDHDSTGRAALPAWYVLRNSVVLGGALVVARVPVGGVLTTAPLVATAMTVPYLAIALGLVAAIVRHRRMLRRGGDVPAQRDLRLRVRRPTGGVMGFRVTVEAAS